MRPRSAVWLGGLFVLLAAVPAAAQTRVPYNDRPNSLRLWAGQFEPSGDSHYWRQRDRDFTGSASDFEDTILGIDYVHMINERMGVIATLSGWEGEDRQSFRDYVDNQGREIFHDTTLDVTSLEGGILYYFRRRNATVSPYIGGGGGFVDYELTESGDFIDFDDFSIFSGTFRDEGSTWGWFTTLGLEVALGQQLALFGEARWTWAMRELRKDFTDFGRIELGGRNLALGVAFRF